MKQVMRLIESLGGSHAQLPFLRWLGETDVVPAERKLRIGLLCAPFAMSFRDINVYHVSYGDDADMTPQQRLLSEHAAEDGTHSKLFLRDARTLEWDALTGFSAGQSLYWLTAHPHTEVDRAVAIRLAAQLASTSNPRLRYPLVETIEVTGHAFFAQIVKPARQFEEMTGKPLVFWGDGHLEMEAGHTTGDESAFEGELTPQERTAAVGMVFDLFIDRERQCNTWLHWGQKAEAADPSGVFATRLDQSSLPTEPGPTMWETATQLKTHPSHKPLLDRLNHQLDDLARVTRANRASSNRNDPLSLLRSALLFSAVETAWLPGIFRYVLPYPSPLGADEAAVNELAASLPVLLPPAGTSQDWRLLAMDTWLEWGFADTIEFLHLNEATEPTRELRAAVTRHLAQTSDPLVRAWIALTACTNAQTRQETALAAAAELWPDPRAALPLLAGHGQISPTARESLAHLLNTPLTENAARRIGEAIDDIAAAYQRCAHAERARA
ncbi:hypothetical protein ABTX85_27265 [Streptomyces sp. NPDC096097]|uniref:hypothetical protein n=1 Tax=Streptomyces sp. NPDC096097 TaxID=3155546 RepID=UPI00332002C1